MTNDIKEMIGHCAACANEIPYQQKEKLQSHDIPSTPWANVGMDLFAHANETYLIIVDYHSDFFGFTKLVDHSMSSPYHSRSNGKSEAAVKIANKNCFAN